MKIVDSKDDPWNSVTSKMSSKDSNRHSLTHSLILQAIAYSLIHSDSIFRSDKASPKIAQDISDTNVESKGDDNSDDENDDTHDTSAAPIVYKIYQFPENVEIKTGEEDEVCELLLRVKLYRLSLPLSVPEEVHKNSVSNESESSSMLSNALSKSNAPSVSLSTENNEPQWIEVGTGPLKVLKSGSRYRLVVRREEKKGRFFTFFPMCLLAYLLTYLLSHSLTC